MIALDRDLLAGVVGGGDDAGGEELPGPNRTSTEGRIRVETPLYSTGWDTGKTTTAKTNYASCLATLPDGTPTAEIRDACGTPNHPKY
ncbi:MAG TPA: hypothetical protein VF516_20875 [Kofleriaceae bacterium]